MSVISNQILSPAELAEIVKAEYTGLISHNMAKVILKLIIDYNKTELLWQNLIINYHKNK